jgi:AmpD protein
MRVTEDHWLAGIRREPSPNCDERPDTADLSLVVIHAISLPPGRFGSGDVCALFQNRLDPSAHPDYPELCAMRVSAHLFIDRRGRCIQFVPFDRRAWHAGLSNWRGRSGCNDFAIGIELEGTDRHLYTVAQYDRLDKVIDALFVAYSTLSPEAIVGHLEIAPGRKTDPGPRFDWPRVLERRYQ